MIALNEKQLEEYFSLKEQYLAKYKNLGLSEFELIPNEFYSIEDYAVLITILQEALEKNVLLAELDYLKDLKNVFAGALLINNIDEAKKGK